MICLNKKLNVVKWKNETLTFCYFHEFKGIMLVYDITNEKSFDNIKNWIRNIEEVRSKWRMDKNFTICKQSLKTYATKNALYSTELHILTNMPLGIDQ